jgi:hypothetical protein
MKKKDITNLTGIELLKAVHFNFLLKSGVDLPEPEDILEFDEEDSPYFESMDSFNY